MSPNESLPERGSVLLPAVFVVMLLGGMGAALVTTSLYRQSAARAMHERDRAFERAMSGLDIAFFEVKEEIDTGSDGIGNASGTVGGGTYEVKVSPAHAGAGEYVVTAVGQFGPAREGIELVVAQPAEGLGFGMFARDTLELGGGAVDSYDSSKGSYASQVSGDHAGEKADVSSNGDISVGVPVYGDAKPGPGFEVLGSPELVTGSTAPASDPKVIDPYVYSPPIASGGSWSGPGTITSGTYRYDEFVLSGGGLVTIDGDVILYVDDKFVSSGGSTIALTSGSTLELHHGANDFKVSGGGFANPDQAPKQLSIYSATLKKVELSGGSSFYGMIYAPEAEFIASGDSHLHGAFAVGKAKLSGSSAIHTDLAMTGGGGGGGAGGGYQIVSARRIRP